MPCSKVERYSAAKEHATSTFRAEVSFMGITVHNNGKGQKEMGILVNELTQKGVVQSLLPVHQTVVSHPTGI
jgi:hypothetical protein